MNSKFFVIGLLNKVIHVSNWDVVYHNKGLFYVCKVVSDQGKFDCSKWAFFFTPMMTIMMGLLPLFSFLNGAAPQSEILQAQLHS